MSTETGFAEREADGADIDLTEISSEDKEFLEGIDRLGGEATTSDLRRETELSRSQIHYRVKKFEEKELITVERPDDPVGNQPTRAELTPSGLDVVDSGVLEKGTDPDATLRQLSHQIKVLEERLETVEVHHPDNAMYHFTEAQRDAIEYWIDERARHNEQVDTNFWFEIFPTIVKELGYEPPAESPGRGYEKQFPYESYHDEDQNLVVEGPDEPTIAERLGQLEERVEEIAEKVDA